MRLFTRFLTLVSLCLCLGFSSKADVAAPDLIYGFMNNAASWSEGDNTEPFWGFYSFSPDGKRGFQAVSPTGVNQDWALTSEGGGASVYDDGAYYCFTAIGLYNNYTLKFTKLDAKTWTPLASSAKGSKTTEGGLIVPVDMTVNPVDGKLYAICRPNLSNTNYGILATVDRNTGELTRLADTRFFKTIACDANGQLYGISEIVRQGWTYKGCELYKINTDGSVVLVGPTDVPLRDNCQSATIDFRTGKMYLSAYAYEGSNGNYRDASLTGLWEIDVNTGKSALLHYYSDYAYVTGISVLNAHPSAPDLIADLTFTPKTIASLDGVVKFTVPTVTYGQKPLSGNVTVTYFIDGTEKAKEVKAVGSKVEKDFTLPSEGVHSVTVVLASDGYEGVPQVATDYFGVDAPDEVTNLVLTPANDNMTAKLTWEAPKGSLNGGTYKPEDVRYTIVRNPGNVTVARAASGTSFTEDVDFKYANTTYTVTPYINGDTNKKGRSVRSNKVCLGSAWEIPYAEAFSYGDVWDSYTVIDANGDGGNWDWEDPVWKYDDIYRCAFFYHWTNSGPSDDWLITPKLNFEEGKLYRITFQLYGYYEGRDHHLRVAVGNAPTVEGMHNILYDETSTSIQTAPLTISRVFASKGNDMYIGFHNLTEYPNHVGIDNIYIQEIGVSTVPSQVKNLKGEVVSRQDHTARLTFDAPTLDVADKPLAENMTVKLYRGDETTPFKEIENVKPGQSVSVDDTGAAPAVNIYRVVPFNSFGEGVESIIKVDMRAGEPASVTNVKAKVIGPNQVAITWDAPKATVDQNGNDIDTENLRYLVYRPLDNGDYDIIARGLTECQFIDNNPRAEYGDELSYVYYYVACVNGDGESIATASNYIFVGDTYKLPFAETWKEQVNATRPWLTSSNGSASWTLAAKGYTPLTDGQDGWGLLSLEINQGVSEGSSVIWSPRMDLSEVKDATLTFWLYGENTYKDNDYIAVAVAVDDEDPVRIANATFYPRRWAGWKQCTVSLKDFVGSSSASVLLMGNIVAQGDERRIHIDNLEVTGTPMAKELKLVSLQGPTEIRTGVPSTYTVTVKNVGSSDASSVPVTMYIDDMQVERKTIDYINAGDTATVTFEYVPGDGIDDVVDMLVELNPAQGADVHKKNNSAHMMIEVLPLNLPYVTDLNGVYFADENYATLEWSNPSEAEFVELITDGAEYYDAFAIEGFGCWTTRDMDGNYPFKFQDPTTGTTLTWDNNDVKQAWMVFRPSDVTSDNTFYPHSGLQTFASWSNADVNKTGVGNDDWLISPELTGDNQLISFYVRRLNDRDKDEKYNVLYSTTDTNPASFKRLNGDTPLVPGAEWEIQFFALPAGTKYFAIQYVGYHQSAVLVDDVQFEAYPTHIRPDGYNVYRNGQLLNSSLIGRKSYTDRNMTFGDTYTYTVCPIFSGIEAAPSNVFTLDTTGVSTPGAADAVAVMSGKGFLRVMNAQGLQTYVYTVDGKKMASRRIVAENEAINLAAGIYVVSVEGKNFKVIVR